MGALEWVAGLVLGAVGVAVVDAIATSSTSSSSASATPSKTGPGSSTAAGSSDFPIVTIELGSGGALPPVVVLGFQSAALQNANAPRIVLQAPDGAYILTVTSSNQDAMLAPSFTGSPTQTTVLLGTADSPGTTTLTVGWVDITSTPQTSTVLLTVT